MNAYLKKDIESDLRRLDDIKEEINNLEIDMTEIEARLLFLENEKAIAERKVKNHSGRMVVMDETAAHNPMLVECINAAWNHEQHSKLFKDIVLALMMRDECEVEEKIGDIKDVTENWVDHLYLYLMRVADDLDLETIVKFVRWDIALNKPTIRE